MAKVVSINISSEKGIPKDPIDKGEFLIDFGLKEDSHGGDWHRQVSLLAQESIEKIKDMGVKDLSPGRFAENITTEGICLYELPVGTQLKIGDTIQEVTQIGKECHTRCAIFHTVGDCVMPKEGIFTKVIKGGTVKAGDSIEVMSNK
ncbi:MOSC domain-containing protein [Alkaliphilus peptidifermentans]|uniref:MOSC domain-containing protein n=1 Tax=Alkaliphilus peptidifermentans DSM 18978 TaxID=1120976 RepID=A0A1G5CMJ4_9FIRM|nr:MOSC domain-containing protein [Alkaliphilus peptidifermentans]SCY03759.1 MOSC domain-containing protein [Alkaliphilus peptidifermentans DSM 18978]